MFNISRAWRPWQNAANKAFSSAKVMFSRLRPPLRLRFERLEPTVVMAMWARFTVLSDTPTLPQ